MSRDVFNWVVSGLLVFSALFSAQHTPASPHYPTATQSQRLDSGLSGSWFDPAKDGQGFTLQVINETQALATWFTYTDDGDQAWLQGIGALSEGDIVFDELNRFTGPKFGDQFDPSDRQTVPAGSLVMSFSSCSEGQATYSGSDEFEADVLALDRLTSLHGFTCGKEATSATESYPPSAVLSGAWYSAQQDGQGWMVEILDAKTALVYWFTYDETGEQRWMLGVGGLDAGTVSVDKLEVITGPSFGSDYDPNDLVTEIWGDVSLHLWPCDKTSARYLSNNRSGRIPNVEPLVTIQGSKPCIPELARETKTEIWTDEGQLVWQGADLEDRTPWCDDSFRWNAPLTHFDVNLDSKPDILLVISCYQGPTPKEQEITNRQVIAGWRMFCSTPEDNHYDCTKELFGTNEIRATLEDDPFGGSPYTHVMEKPKDLNGDGYPEFFYALNRDDGRPGIDPYDPDNHPILTELCGDLSNYDNNLWDWDCTWTSAQTMLISSVNEAGEVSYRVAALPWRANFTQAMLVLPNHLDGWDIISFQYAPWYAARLNPDNTFTDVTEEYEDYLNAEPALTTRPYATTFEHEGHHYVVTSRVNNSVFEDLPPSEQPVIWNEESNWQWGMTLWRWKPGVGFEVSDYYIPPPEDRFTYKESDGNGGFNRKVGVVINSVPVYDPAWNFHDFGQLHPSEEPVLVVAQESASTVGDYFKRPHNPDLIYDRRGFGGYVTNLDYENMLFPVTPIEGFYIRDGKLVKREQPVVEGGAAWSIASFDLMDVTGDGLLDLVGHTGGSERGSIYLNDGRGTLEKVNLRVTDPNTPLKNTVDPRFPWVFAGFTVRDLGRAPYLEYIFWGLGSYQQQWETEPHNRGYPFAILKAAEPITKAPLESAEEFHEFLGRCMPSGCSDYFAGWVP